MKTMIHVRSVNGRFPQRSSPVFDAASVEASVQPLEAGRVRVRLDDTRADYSDFWFEVTLDISKGEEHDNIL